MILRAYHTELDPTAEQRRALARHVGGARVAHNFALEKWHEYDRARAIAIGLRALSGLDSKSGELAAWLGYALTLLHFGEPVKVRTPKGDLQRYRYRHVSGALIPDKRASTVDWNSVLVATRDEQPERFGWLTEISAFAVREAVLDVNDAWKHFFEHLKAGRYERAGEPRFRRATQRQYHVDQPDPIRITERSVKIPSIGWVRLKEHGYLPSTEADSHRFPNGGKAIGLGLSERAGRWYVSLRCEVPNPTPQARGPGRALRERPTPRIPGRRMGVENGVRVLAVGYDGDASTAIVDPGLRDDDRIHRLTRRRKLWERAMARRQTCRNCGKAQSCKRCLVVRKEQSAGWREAVRQIAHYHARIAQIRDDRVGKIVRKIVDRGAETILLREPHAAKLLDRRTAPDARVRNRLAPDVHGARMGDLRARLEYKQVWAGGKVELVDKFEPVTKRCSQCGVVRDDSPSYPNFKCPSCGHTEDRDDANAPRNLHDYSGGSSSGAAGPRSAGSKPPKGDNGPEKRMLRQKAKARSTASQGGEISALGSDNRPCAGAPCSARPIDPRYDTSLERRSGAMSGSEQFRSDTATGMPTSPNLSQTASEVREKSTRLPDESGVES